VGVWGRFWECVKIRRHSVVLPAPLSPAIQLINWERKTCRWQTAYHNCFWFWWLWKEAPHRNNAVL
jgi:hypothetical protein